LRLAKIVGAEYLDFVQPTDRDIGKRSLFRVGEVHVVGDRARIDRLIRLNGGLALNTCALPTSLSVNQTWLPSGIAAMFGQNGLSCLTLATIP
jgi:hypothetical protein